VEKIIWLHGKSQVFQYRVDLYMLKNRLQLSTDFYIKKSVI
jgi:hypothetical protein